jgi:hypothetical protein
MLISQKAVLRHLFKKPNKTSKFLVVKADLVESRKALDEKRSN